MKYSLSFLLVALAAFSTSSNAGSAVIPEWRQHVDVWTCFNVSNVSSDSVGVTIKLYKADGSLYTGSTLFGGAVNSEFTLLSKNTIEMCVPASTSNNIGFGTIEGRDLNGNVSNESLVARAAISDVKALNKWQSITINGGKPF